MARPIYEYTESESGSIEVIKNQHGYNVIFSPPEEAFPRGHDSKEEYKQLIARMNLEKTAFTFFPFKGRGLYAMQPKYLNLAGITVEIQCYNANELDVEDTKEIFANLPEVFIENYNYGLGFLKKYNQIASFIETLGAKHLYIMKHQSTSYDRELEVMTINEKDLRILQKNIDKISARASKISSSTKHDVVAEILLEFIGRSKGYSVKLEKTNVNDRISKIALMPLNEVSGQRQKEAIEIVTANTRKMLQEQPDKLVKLRNDIELVTLDGLITKFALMLKDDLEEFRWQRLLEENPFILNMAFGVPIIKVYHHAYVGGQKIAGGGDKITDFLVKNSISNNAAIIEIKKPTTRLLGATTYRQDVYSPSSELSGAINQLLDQIYKFQKNIASLKEESGIYNIETYSVVGVLLIGRSMAITSQRKSFELFRGNSKNIIILTFDELLERLKQLRTFLGDGNSNYPGDEDLPF